MLPRLTIGFIVLTLVVGIAACSSYGANNIVNVGPNFPKMTLYAANSNQNAVSIYNKGQSSGTGPAFQIGGSSTTLNGPQYLAFDSSSNLWVTNYNPSTNAAVLVEIEALATGNVLPLQTTPLAGRMRGIAITPKSSKSKTSLMIVADTIPTAKYPSELLLFVEGNSQPYQAIAGPNPSLQVPGGVSLDTNNNIYVANVQGAKVQQFTLPTPTPSPKGSPTPTASPSPTPSPTTSPSGSPSPSPTPSPTPTPINIVPNFTISGSKTGLVTPTSVDVDSNGNIYISDLGNSLQKCPARIYIFANPGKQTGGIIINAPPTRIIAGCNTQLKAPTDVKVNSTLALIYVADGSTILVFPLGASGNIAPTTTYKSPGAVTGLGLVP